jgi:hypothetical protein
MQIPRPVVQNFNIKLLLHTKRLSLTGCSYISRTHGALQAPLFVLTPTLRHSTNEAQPCRTASSDRPSHAVLLLHQRLCYSKERTAFLALAGIRPCCNLSQLCPQPSLLPAPHYTLWHCCLSILPCIAACKPPASYGDHRSVLR